VSSREIRLFIVSGNRLLREVLGRIFKARARISVNIAEHLTPQAAQQIIASESDVLLLDSLVPIFENPAHVRDMRSALAALKIVLMGMENDERIFLESVKRGVAGYILRDASAADVVAAVRAVVASETIFPPRYSRVLFNFVAEHSVAAPPSLPENLPFPLTRRERQLVPLIAQGLTNKEIAARFNLSEQTVKNHIHRICCKVGAEGRLEILNVCRVQGATHSRVSV